MFENIGSLKQDLTSISETLDQTIGATANLKSDLFALEKSNENKRAYMQQEHDHTKRRSEQQIQELLSSTQVMNERNANKINSLERKIYRQQREQEEMEDSYEKNAKELSEVKEMCDELQRTVKDQKVVVYQTINNTINQTVDKSTKKVFDIDILPINISQLDIFFGKLK